MPSLQRPVAFSFPFGTYQGGAKTPKSLSWLLIPVGLRRNQPVKAVAGQYRKGGAPFLTGLAQELRTGPQKLRMGATCLHDIRSGDGGPHDT